MQIRGRSSAGIKQVGSHNVEIVRELTRGPSFWYTNVCPYVAHSSRGQGHLPLKEEIRGSNPLCATIYRPACAGYLFIVES